MRPERLLELGRRNDVKLPARTVGGLQRFCRFSGFDRFIEVWVKTTAVLRRHGDFRQIVVDYAAELAAQGCFYAEPLFSPSEPVLRGTPWQEVFDGYCEGADEARGRHGVDLRFTPDVTRNFPPETGEELAGWAVPVSRARRGRHQPRRERAPLSARPVRQGVRHRAGGRAQGGAARRRDGRPRLCALRPGRPARRPPATRRARHGGHRAAGGAGGARRRVRRHAGDGTCAPASCAPSTTIPFRSCSPPA